MKIRYILYLLPVAFLLGTCATPKVAYFTDLTGYRRSSIEPAGDPGASRRQDLRTSQQQGPLVDEPFQPSDHIQTDRYDIGNIQ